MLSFDSQRWCNFWEKKYRCLSGPFLLFKMARLQRKVYYAKDKWNIQSKKFLLHQISFEKNGFEVFETFCKSYFVTNWTFSVSVCFYRKHLAEILGLFVLLIFCNKEINNLHIWTSCSKITVRIALNVLIL